MIIETARLRIVPLTAEQFRLLVLGVDRMETEMGLISSGERPDKHTRQAIEYQYQKTLSDTDNLIWLTNRQIILKSENKAIAGANFKNSPLENEYIEIGYGTHAGYRNMGYMTEAVQAMCEWALSQPGVKAVTAETERGNFASHRVLQKCGFTNYKEDENGLWWKLDRIKNSNNQSKKTRI
ncbi:GNAT family N-acetyltransferase [Dysgonomonas termitidis]|uniref:GNAT family N-acetyltransferase n=1 Tax=Dysgonomonas termitidis TaxID=1516126 RepID=A0ABV9KUA3_9BACT